MIDLERHLHSAEVSVPAEPLQPTLNKR